MGEQEARKRPLRLAYHRRGERCRRASVSLWGMLDKMRRTLMLWMDKLLNAMCANAVYGDAGAAARRN